MNGRTRCAPRFCAAAVKALVDAQGALGRGSLAVGPGTPVGFTVSAYPDRIDREHPPAGVGREV